MDQTQFLKTYVNISKDIKKRFTSQKTFALYFSQLEEIVNCLKKTSNFECMSMFSNLKGKCEDLIGKKTVKSGSNLQIGRCLFEKCLSDISKGQSITYEEYIDAIFNYELAIKNTNSKSGYLAGCYMFEMATYLQRLVKLSEAAERYHKAAELFENFSNLRVISYWQAICCCIYLNEFSQAKSLIEKFNNIIIDDFYIIARDSKIIHVLINVMQNSRALDITPFFQPIPISQQDKEQETYVYLLIKAICVSYVEGNLESFRELENIILPFISLEQQYILNEMRYRCENPSCKLAI